MKTLYCVAAGGLLECSLRDGNKHFIVKRALDMAEAKSYAQVKGYLMLFINPAAVPARDKRKRA